MTTSVARPTTLDHEPAVRSGRAARNLALARDQQDDLERLLGTVLASWPRNLDHSCQMCRLCDLSACPADQCPVEQRYQQFEAETSAP